MQIINLHRNPKIQHKTESLVLALPSHVTVEKLKFIIMAPCRSREASYIIVIFDVAFIVCPCNMIDIFIITNTMHTIWSG